jgi:hypothetical protein
MPADDLKEAISLARQGKMNPKTFKKIMPNAAAHFLGNFDRSVSTAFFVKIQGTIMDELQRPHLMEEPIPFIMLQGESQKVELRAILSYSSVLTGFNREVYDTAPYKDLFFRAYLANVEQKHEMFPIDGDILIDMFFSAFVKTAYEFENEMVETSQIDLLEICPKVNDPEGFVKELIAFMEASVTLPRGVADVEELIEHAKESFNARAITNAFVKTVRVLKEFPDHLKCLQCWVCGKDSPKTCGTCKIAAFCCRQCQGKAWKKNHKQLCAPYKQIMDFAEAQCNRIKQARKESFVCPGSSLLQPNQFFDYITVIRVTALLAQNGSDTLSEQVTMDSFYKNLVKVENDDTAFSGLFKRGTGRVEASMDSVVNICVGLMCNGNQPEALPTPKISRASFFRSYTDVDGFVKQSEEMVIASVIEDLMKLYQEG